MRSLRPLRIAAVAATAALALAAAAPGARAQTAFALRADIAGTTSLVSFDVANPGAVSTIGPLTIGGSTLTTLPGSDQPIVVSLDSMDFRVFSNTLYGYWDATDTVYTVNTATGALTSAFTFTGATNTNLLDIDFNPTTPNGAGTGAQFRIVTDAEENVVINVTNGALAGGVTSLFYPAGDPAASLLDPSGQPLGPGVIGNAYTNNVANPTGGTVQFGIDYLTDSLITIANNAGTLTTVGGSVGNLGVQIDDNLPYVGFDIFTALGGGGATTDTAYAILNSTFYTINISSVASNIGPRATAVGALGGGAAFGFYGLAVANPTVAAAAPEPGSFVLAGMGLIGAAGAAIRRRRTRVA